MGIILQPFGLLLNWLYALTGSYGLAIIAFGLVFKILLFPISIRGRRGMLDMSRLSDKQKELQEKFGKDRTKYSVELQKLYTTEGVKPSSGCIWSFLSMPVLMILYFILSQPFTYLMGLSSDQIQSLTQLILGADAKINSQLVMAQDVYLRFDEVTAALPEVSAKIAASGGPINFDFFGLNLSTVPDFLFFQKGFTMVGFGLFLIPVIAGVLALFSILVNTKLNQYILGKKTSTDQQNRMMLIIMPMFSLWLGFTLPSALGLYWAANSAFSILQELCSVGMLKKHVAKMRAEAEVRAVEMKEQEQEKKRIAAEQKKQKAEEQKRIKLERKVSTDGITESSRIGARAYARGRTFDASRYPVMEYRDPDDIIKEQRAAAKKAQEEHAANKGSKKKGKASKKDGDTGMILNGEGTRDNTPQDENRDD